MVISPTILNHQGCPLISVGSPGYEMIGEFQLLQL
jgi:gamma-glutamyltranspeptidase